MVKSKSLWEKIFFSLSLVLRDLAKKKKSKKNFIVKPLNLPKMFRKFF